MRESTKAFWKKLAEAFEDQGGGADLKLILGCPIIITAVIFVMLTRDLATFAAIAGLGGGLVGLSLAGDQGRLNVSSSESNPSAGIPGS